MNMEYIYRQTVCVLHCNICIFDEEGTLLQCYGDSAEEVNPLLMDREFLHTLLQRKEKEYPDIFHEKNGILYAVILQNGKRLIAGPVCVEQPTREVNDYMVSTHGIKETLKYQVPFCESKIFFTGILMLFHLLTGMELSLDELWRKNEIEHLDLARVQKSISEVIFERQERALPHNPYDQEVRELDSIRHGNIEMLRKSLAETYCGEVGQLSKDQVRQAKNIAICVITLASRAAIDGGMLPEEAFSMVDGYILKIEEMCNIVKIDAMMRQAEYEFAEMVAQIQEKSHKNELIERVKTYIFQNLHNEIVIGEIGREIGVNMAYLSDLFHRLEGITIQQYIRKKKVYLAENMLRYSEYDVKDIANYLAFCSQSYFGQVFKKETGLSPAKYRKKYGQWRQKQK